MIGLKKKKTQKIDKKYYSVILLIFFFIQASVFPIYFLGYHRTNFLTTFVFSVFTTSVSIFLMYIMEDRRKIIFIILFFLSFFIFSLVFDLYGLNVVDILLYGVMYGTFFIICGIILYKWERNFYERFKIILIGYLLQGTYDWTWAFLRWFETWVPPDLHSPFYVDLIVYNSTLLSVFIVEIINVALAFILIFYRKKNLILIAICSNFLLMQAGTLMFSFTGIFFPYWIWFIIIIGFTILIFYLRKKKYLFHQI